MQRASEAPDGRDHDLPGYDARRVLRENRDCAQSLFLKYSWKSGGTGYVTVRHDSEVKGSRDSGPRNLSGASGLGQDLTGFAKRYLRQKILFGRRSGREGDRRRCE